MIASPRSFDRSTMLLSQDQKYIFNPALFMDFNFSPLTSFIYLIVYHLFTCLGDYNFLVEYQYFMIVI